MTSNEDIKVQVSGTSQWSSQDLAAIMSEKEKPHESSGVLIAMWNEGIRELKSFLWWSKSECSQTVSKQYEKESNSISEAITVSTRSKDLAYNQIDIGMVKWEENKRKERNH